MFKKLLFGAAAAGAVVWLSKNQEKAKAYADRYGGQLKGAAQNVTPGAGRAPAEERLNDPALVQKVESELFRDEHIHHVKGHINFNAEYGVIYIRGEVPDEATREDIRSGRAAWTACARSRTSRISRASPPPPRTRRARALTSVSKAISACPPRSVGGMSDAAIETQGLVREFKKGPRAVDGIDLRVEPGEVYGFLGPNGAGKSTTVHMLTTLLPPTAGRAWVAGHDVVEDGPAVRATIGAALQDAALDPFLTGREHLRLQTALHGMTGDGGARALGAAARARRPRAGRRPPRGRLLRRHAAPARPRARACAPARASCSSTSPPPASTCRAGAPCGRRCSGSRRTAA